MDKHEHGNCSLNRKPLRESFLSCPNRVAGVSPCLSSVAFLTLPEVWNRLQFVRYADDVAICVRTPKAAGRVKRSVSRFITGRLKLVVNEEKSAVARPWHSKYLQQPHRARRRPALGNGGRQHPQGRLAAQQERNGMRGAA